MTFAVFRARSGGYARRFGFLGARTPTRTGRVIDPEPEIARRSSDIERESSGSSAVCERVWLVGPRSRLPLPPSLTLKIFVSPMVMVRTGGVVHSYSHSCACADIPRRIPCDCGKRVRAVGRGGAVPGDRVGRGGVFGAEVGGAVELELHAGDSHVIRGGGGDRDRGTRDGGAAGRSGDGNRRRGRVRGGRAAKLDDLCDGRDAVPVQEEEQVVARRRNYRRAGGPTVGARGP